MGLKEMKGTGIKRNETFSTAPSGASVAGNCSVEEGQFKIVSLKPNSLSSRISEESDLWKGAERHLGGTNRLEKEITQVKS